LACWYNGLPLPVHIVGVVIVVVARIVSTGIVGIGIVTGIIGIWTGVFWIAGVGIGIAVILV